MTESLPEFHFLHSAVQSRPPGFEWPGPSCPAGPREPGTLEGMWRRSGPVPVQREPRRPASGESDFTHGLPKPVSADTATVRAQYRSLSQHLCSWTSSQRREGRLGYTLTAFNRTSRQTHSRDRGLMEGEERRMGGKKMGEVLCLLCGILLAATVID